MIQYKVNNISAKDLYNLSLRASLGIFFILLILAIIMNLFGWGLVNYNEKQASRWMSILINIITFPIYAFLYSLFQFVFLYVGIKLSNLIKK